MAERGKVSVNGKVAFVLTVLLYSLLDVSKMGLHFHKFNNDQNLILSAEKCWQKLQQEITFSLSFSNYCRVNEHHICKTYESISKNMFPIWMQNKKMAASVCLFVCNHCQSACHTEPVACTETAIDVTFSLGAAASDLHLQ